MKFLVEGVGTLFLVAVVVGSGICLERFEDYKTVLKSSDKPS